MQIGQLAKRSGVAIDTVRYYERHGLLPKPLRQPSGYRHYDEQDLVRLRFIKRAKALGFTLHEVQELLALSDHRAGNVAGIKAAATEKLADVEHRLEELTRIRDGLRSLIEACPGHGDPSQCPILGALAKEDA
jgi:MerR family transcriptional regulator, copper efflux regulator